MTRTDIINTLIKQNNFKSYLEIGVLNLDHNFNHINCKNKIGVDIDPNSKATFIMSSDSYFTNCMETFDIIFIDGLHTNEQVRKDIDNSLKILNPKGIIVCHDMSPSNKDMQLPFEEVQGNCWTGNVWEEWVRLKQTNQNLKMFVVNTDFGVGIIKRGFQELLESDIIINYDNLELNRKQWLNLISTNDFILYSSIPSNLL
jgi:hypothetical protein